MGRVVGTTCHDADGRNLFRAAVNETMGRNPERLLAFTLGKRNIFLGGFSKLVRNGFRNHPQGFHKNQL